MSTLRVGVPPGVGDTYWCLTKLKALREERGAERVELCVRKSRYDRSLAWAQMVDFVDECTVTEFDPGEALQHGYGKAVGLDCVLWPNAIVDRGVHLNHWLPHLPIDLDFPIRGVDMGESRAIVYVSSMEIDRAWMQGRGRRFWEPTIEALAKQFGRITLVGAAWDLPMRERVNSPGVEDLVGQTTLPQLVGLIKAARLVVGVICGVTILANHLRVPCVAFWPDWKFPAGFPRAWVAADVPYIPVPVSTLSGPAEVASIAAAVVG